MLLALGYMVSSLFGIGVLLLPSLVQQLGVGYSIALLTAVAVALNLAAYIVLELIQTTGDDVESSVRSFLGRYGGLATASLGVFTYSALAAYIIAAGDQLAAWLGGNPHYWSALFFVLAAVPAIGGLTLAASASTYLSMFLVTVLVFVVPVNLKFQSLVLPFYGDLSAAPLFMVLAAFALTGHFSIYQVHRFVKDERSNLVVFFASFAFAYLSYLAFGITTAAVSPNLADLSTATLAQIYPPFYALLVSAVALLAFYTSFVTVAHSFLKTFDDYVSRRSLYALLLLPIAVLYVLVRDYPFLSLASLVGKLGGVSMLLFLSLACAAHYRASGKWKLKFPRDGSLALGVLFAGMALIGLFL
jgi:amino acid permease